MPTTNDLSFNDPFRVLVFGQYKTGKTEFAATFSRPNFIDFDGGIITVIGKGFVQRHGRREIMFDQFPAEYDPRGFPKNYEPFDRACRYFDACMSSGKEWTAFNGKRYQVGRDMFDTWVVDSATTGSELSLAKAVILLGGKDSVARFGQQSGTLSGVRDFGLLVPKIQDYGAERSMLEQFVQMTKDSGKMFVLICHEKELRGKAPAPGVPGPVEAYVPLLTGKSVQTIPIMFNEVYNSRVRPFGETMKYYLQTEPDGLRACGSRLGIPNEIDNTWDAIKSALDVIRAEQSQPAPVAKE
jgi:hypothetical protein